MGLTTELRDYRLALASPLVTAHGVHEYRDGVLFAISDGVHVGWGEAAPLPGWSRESCDDCRRGLESVAPRLSECDSVDDPRLTEILAELETHPHARAAIAGASLDLAAQSDGVSLGSLLNGRFGSVPREALPHSVSVNGLISDLQPERVAAAAAELASEGISAVKLKVAATDSNTDVARVAATRSAIGDDIELRLDANGGWDIETAVDTLRRMADYDITFCEEPTAGIDGIAVVGAAGVVPVAVDESAVTVGDIAAALKTDAIRVVIVKPQALGGSDLAMAALAMAEETGAGAVVTSMIDSAVGVAHAAHFAAAVLPEVAHGLATSTLLAEDTAPRLNLEGGRLHLPQSPGLGVSPVF
ncbi:MAG: o-succinylbenzoate synthase [Acidimicrobiaceae bacterium]|nr:o-succinylbenzoate synthase [Acidimicrobiaceae bacterium]MYG55969.1 o-succinylbenzoate synthase [Acidimicrobiaceae bacterium]MYJ97865.1 o-succinylbenzoate synthase [Acidimicrobiaceae bacterium]